MTLAEIEAKFDISRDLRILTLGKWEGCARWVPYFWEKLLEGFADFDDEARVASFIVTDDDIREFPELKGVYAVDLYESDNGFVHETVWTSEKEFDDELERRSEEAEEEDDPEEFPVPY